MMFHASSVSVNSGGVDIRIVVKSLSETSTMIMVMSGSFRLITSMVT